MSVIWLAHSTVQCSTVQFSAVYRLCVGACSLHYNLEHLIYITLCLSFCSTDSMVQYSTVQYSAVYRLSVVAFSLHYIL